MQDGQLGNRERKERLYLVLLKKLYKKTRDINIIFYM